MPHSAFHRLAAAAQGASGGDPDASVARVDAIYAALARGDQTAALAALAPDIAWEQGWSAAPLPIRQPRRSPEEEARLAAELEALGRVQVVRLAGLGCEVAALVADGFAVTAAGQAARRFEVHLWTLDEDGRVARFCRLASVGATTRH